MIRIYSIKKTNSVILTIEDNGVGIVTKDINRVFLRKDLLERTAGDLAKSTGMGLYLCEKLCSKLGLKIGIESEVNKGTRVTLIFPLSGMVTFESYL